MDSRLRDFIVRNSQKLTSEFLHDCSCFSAELRHRNVLLVDAVVSLQQTPPFNDKKVKMGRGFKASESKVPDCRCCQMPK